MFRALLLSILMMLYLALPSLAQPRIEVQKVTGGVYALVGPTTQRDPQNLGNNSTHGLIVTSEGAILIDAGGSWKGAEALDTVIKGLTDQPVRYVINSGGQDHRWLGNGYWQAQGAIVIASADAVADQQARASMQLTALSMLIGPDALAGTEPAYANQTFEGNLAIDLGGVNIHLIHTSGGHTPGDSTIWLPAQKVAFAGDLVYVGRVLGVMNFSNTAHWLESFDAMAALDPAFIVPGHGPVTDLATATRDTRDYLANLREKIAAHIENGGDIITSVDVDQSAFAYLDNFDTLARRNAQETFSQMEWE